MEAIAKKKSKAAPSEVEDHKDPVSQDAKRAPVKTFLIEDVSASIFTRVHPYKGQPTTFYSVSFTRSYKDARGQYQYAKSFDVEDLGKIVTLAQQASEYIHGLRSEPEAQEA